MTFEKDLTTGSVLKKLIVFAFPIFVSNLIQSVYGMVDLMVVSNFGGTNSVSGVNTGNWIMVVVINLICGISTGGTVVVARYLGAKKKEQIKDVVGTLFISLLVFGSFMTVVIVAFAKDILNLMNTPIEAYDEAYRYLLVCSFGTLFMVGYNTLASVMQGLGDGKTPLKFVSLSCVVNLILDIIFVKYLNMGAGGAATATVIAQGLAMFTFIIYLKRRDFLFDFKLKSFVFVRRHLADILKAGLPNGIQMVATNGSFLLLTTFINRLGVAASAATGMVNQFNGFAIMIQVAMSAAGSSMISQNVGARDMVRGRKTMCYVLGICTVLSLMVFAFVRLWPELVMKIFDAEPEVVREGVMYFEMFAFEYLCLPVIIGLNAMFIGTGNGWIPLVVDTFSSFAIRIPVAYVLTNMGLGIIGIGASVPIASAVAVYVSAIFYLSGVWKKAFVEKNVWNPKKSK